MSTFIKSVVAATAVAGVVATQPLSARAMEGDGQRFSQRIKDYLARKEQLRALERLQRESGYCLMLLDKEMAPPVYGTTVLESVGCFDPSSLLRAR
ncbi:MAG: hypothetical protein H6922_00545 [Pseudomonadaceae bacterium]|nr:hypothetical protein [Pseudomonadaceae bacterium]